jgi:hypothetical protein|tara:strand:+ start:1475 stop:1630 length:156 start_codon:yes stop_codon:yes gene_type:complete
LKKSSVSSILGFFNEGALKKIIKTILFFDNGRGVCERDREDRGGDLFVGVL